MNRRGNRGGVALVPIEDNTSPYYLHASDNPSLQLVPQLLTGSNYINWSRSVVTALIAKNKLSFANGSLPRPPIDDLLSPSWIRCNSMVISWLRNSVSPQICSSIMYIDDAHELWLDLRDRFSQIDSARSYQLKQKLMFLTQGNSDVNTYFTNLRIVWDEFKHAQPIAWCTCTTCRCDSTLKWHKYQEDDCTMQFLIGLNSSFSQIRSSILATVPLPSLSKVFSMVVQEERQKSIEGYMPSPTVTSSEQPYANATSTNFGRGRLLCSHCGRNNHTVDRCYSLHGFPQSYGRGRGKPPFKDYNNSKSVNFVDDHISDQTDKAASSFSGSMAIPSSDQCQQLISLLQSQLAAISSSSPTTPSTSAAQINSAAHTSSAAQIPSTSTPSHFPFTGTTLFPPFIASISVSSPLWILDTGATHHVCCDITLFLSSSPVDNASVNLPNGAKATVTHIGSVYLTSAITLHSVLCVPTFTFNLISISSLTSSLSCVVNFTHDSITIQGTSQGIQIGKGSRVGNLYILDVKSDPISGSTHSACINSAVSVDLWHCRLGHLSFNKLKSMSSYIPSLINLIPSVKSAL